MHKVIEEHREQIPFIGEKNSRRTWQGDLRGLIAELTEHIRGEVRFDAGSRALYATDASNYRQVPIGVIVPKDAQDVIAAVQICHRHGAPVLPRGGGTSLGGQCCNVAVVMDMTKYMTSVHSSGRSPICVSWEWLPPD